jgi:hypothetical protein
MLFASAGDITKVHLLWLAYAYTTTLKKRIPNLVGILYTVFIISYQIGIIDARRAQGHGITLICITLEPRSISRWFRLPLSN